MLSTYARLQRKAHRPAFEAEDLERKAGLKPIFAPMPAFKIIAYIY